MDPPNPVAALQKEPQKAATTITAAVAKSIWLSPRKVRKSEEKCIRSLECMERTTASFKTIQGLRWFESDKLPNIVLGFLACSFKKLFKSFAWEVPTACLITYPSIAQASKSDSKPQMMVGIYSDPSRTSNWSSSNCNCSGNNNNNNMPGNPTCPPHHPS